MPIFDIVFCVEASHATLKQLSIALPNLHQV